MKYFTYKGYHAFEEMNRSKFIPSGDDGKPCDFGFMVRQDDDGRLFVSKSSIHGFVDINIQKAQIKLICFHHFGVTPEFRKKI